MEIWHFTDDAPRTPHRTHCPGILRWRVGDRPEVEESLVPVGGVMAGTSCYQKTIGPFSPDSRRLRFSFECRHVACPGGLCCMLGEREVEIAGPMRPGV